MIRFILAPCLLLSGCAAALPAVGSKPASDGPVATPSPSAGPIALPSPPPGWFTASFADTTDTNARTMPFDTRAPKPPIGANASVTANWSDRYAMLHGQQAPRAFALAASWFQGSAPPPSLARTFELRFAAPPHPGGRYALVAAAPGEASAQLWFSDEYRFADNVWQAEAGTVVCSAGADGLMHVELRAARMAPRFQGLFFGSDARGSFTLTGSGDFPVGLEPTPAPSPVQSCPPPKGPDVLALSIHVYDKAGRPYRGGMAVRVESLDPDVPYLDEQIQYEGAVYIGNAPPGVKAAVTVTPLCGQPVTRAITLLPGPGSEVPACGSTLGFLAVDFGGPDAPSFAVEAPAAGPSPSCAP